MDSVGGGIYPGPGFAGDVTDFLLWPFVTVKLCHRYLVLQGGFGEAGRGASDGGEGGKMHLKRP